MKADDKAAWLRACDKWHANSGGKDLGEFMFQRGIEYAIEREPQVWRNTALRIGEYLCSAVSDGYYDMTPHEWLQWALNVVYESRKQEPVAFVDANGDLIPKVKLQPWTDLYTTPPAPVQPAIEVNQQVLKALQAAIDCGMVPKISAKAGGAAKHLIQAQVADQIRSAIAAAEAATAEAATRRFIDVESARAVITAHEAKQRGGV